MILKDDYTRVCAAVPETRVAAVEHNVSAMLEILADEEVKNCNVVVFPELCLTGYTCGDLFKQETLISSAEQNLDVLLKRTGDYDGVIIAGLPLSAQGKMFNCAAVMQNGHLLGVVPKTYIPGYKEYYEPRWFISGEGVEVTEVTVAQRQAPFGTDLIFRNPGSDSFALGVELCEDLWAPIPPSSRAALAGATIIANPSASNALVGKNDYRLELIKQQSARCLCGYVYSSAGLGESTTDLVFRGQTAIAENGNLIEEGRTFTKGPRWAIADIDCSLLYNERLHNVTFSHGSNLELPMSENQSKHRSAFRYIPFQHEPAKSVYAGDLRREINPWPFVPQRSETLSERCRDVFSIQTSALAKRLEHTGMKNVVLGLSGGLDSTLALLVTTEAFDRLRLDRTGIHCFTLPGFGTSDKTMENVQQLCHALDLHLKTVDITESSKRQLWELGHSEEARDTVFENVQARQRTQFLMNMANKVEGLVVGTGDLSELALGWCTYNADQMSMYGVNAGVPKTLVQFVIKYIANNWAGAATAQALQAILSTPITPELLPPAEGGEIQQKTEEVIGPYELHDFFLYQMMRRGFGPEKTFALAEQAFNQRYEAKEIKQWLELFYRRFFSQQFKRSCMPDGPQVGSVGLSPRGNWRMPSDAVPDEWLRRLANVETG